MKKNLYTNKENYFYILMFIIICFLLIMMLFKAQDKEWENLSRKAMKECNGDTYKLLVFDEDLQYWKCLDPK